MSVPMHPVTSSRITYVGWQDDVLYVTFTKGATYKYNAVPEDVFNELKNHESPGKYFEYNIKGHYNSEHI